MKICRRELILPGVTGVAAVLAIAIWLRTGPPFAIELRRPGMDRSPDVPAAGVTGTKPQPAVAAGKPTRGEGTPSELSGAWPGFRGPHRDAICDDGVRLARSWPPGGPPVLWRITLGEGYAGAAIYGGCVYVLDYDEAAQADTMRCLSLDDGREVWRNSYPVAVTRNHGISRTVPCVVEDSVISIGPRCHVACWDARSGECRWLMDLVREHGAREPRWYTGQCPLVDQGRLVLAPCGDAMLMAVDYKSGEVIWRSPNPRRWEMTHVSVMPMDFAGRRMYVYCGSGGVAGIAAEDGALLWETVEWPVQFAHAPSPLPLPGGRIFLCSGYGNDTGAMILQLSEAGDKFAVKVAARLTPKQFNAEQQTPILYQGCLIGARKRGGGQLVCLDMEGKELWNSGSDRFGHGPFVIADGLIFALESGGRLVVAEASITEYKRLAEFQVFENGTDAWGPIAVASGRLVVRDMTRMACLDVSAR